MTKTQIEIHNIHPDFKIIATNIRGVVQSVLKEENFLPQKLSIVFVEDEYLRRLHREFLKDDSYTDVMAFDLGDNKGTEGEIYISIDRAKFYAQKLHLPLDEEIARLIIHGVLHLKGYNDETDAQRQQMHQRENDHLRFLEPLPELVSNR